MLNKYFIPFLLVCLLYGGAIWKWYDISTKAPLNQENKLINDAEVASCLINGDDYASLIEKRTIPREKYNQVLETLAQFHKAHPEVAHLYTVAKINGDNYTLFDTYPRVKTLNPNHKYSYPSKGIEKITDTDQGLDKALSGETSTEKNQPIRFTHGADIARYIPIKTKNGDTVGVLALTMNKSETFEEKNKATQELIINLSIYTILALFTLLYVKSKNHQIEKREGIILRTEEQFKTLTERMPGAVYIYNTKSRSEKGNLLFLSEGSKKLLNITQKEAEDSWTELTNIVPEMQRPLESGYIKRCRIENIPWECEFQSPETKIWIQNKATPKKDESGNIVWFGTLNDISLQKLEAAKLGETNNILKRISESPDNAVTLNTICEYACSVEDEAVLHLNTDKETQAIAGTKISEDLINVLQKGRAIGSSEGGPAVASIQKSKLHIASIQDSSFYKNAEDLKTALLDDGIKSTTVYPLINDNGVCLGCLEILHKNYQPEEINNAREEQAAHLALSALERHQVKKTLEENEKRYRTLFETSPFGICETDEDGGIIFTNKAFETTLNESSKAKLTGKYSEEGKKEIKQGKAAYLADTTKIEKANGKHYLITFLADISEQKQKEEKAITSKEIAEAANKAKSEFLAVMSHEIRTPLNGVIGFSQILESMQLGAKEKNLISKIRQSGETLLATINDILDLSKIEAGRIDIEKRSFCLKETIEMTRDILLPKATDKKIYINVETDIPETIIGDETRIRQILINLTGNAVKFTEHGGININAQFSNDILTLKVKDTGIGISKENQKKLFQPFSQADSSTTRKYGGTGLGLVICKKLAEHMGGSILLESEEGEGSSFTLTIPAEVGESIEKRKKEIHIEEDLLPLNILIAEDDEVNRMVIEGLLKNCGHEIEFAKNGREALEKSEELKDWADIILMDMRMPEMDGLEATRAIRAQEKEQGRKPILIYALTANALEEDKEKCLSSGMNNYISKPIDLVILKKALLICQKRKRKEAVKPEEAPKETFEAVKQEAVKQIKNITEGIRIELEEEATESTEGYETIPNNLDNNRKEDSEDSNKSDSDIDTFNTPSTPSTPTETAPKDETFDEIAFDSAWGFGDEKEETIIEPEEPEETKETEETNKQENNDIKVVVNEETIKCFSDAIGIDKFKNTIYPTFKEGCNTARVILTSNYSTALEKRNAAHKLSGSSGTFGCATLEKLMRELETHYIVSEEPHKKTPLIEKIMEKTLEKLEGILEKEE